MGGETLRVLVVEDEDLIRWAVGEALMADGHTVIEAADAASARHLAQEASEPFNVIVLDFRLPDSSDFQLLQDLKTCSPSSAVVMMTACGDPALTAAALGLGACCVLDKPFDLAALTARVRELSAVAA